MHTCLLESLRKHFSEFKLKSNIPERKVMMSSVALVVRVRPGVQLPDIDRGNIEGVLQKLKSIEESYPSVQNAESFY